MLCEVWKMSWKFILTPINTSKAGKGENRDVKWHESHQIDFSVEKEPTCQD
jgi:hypothetical protein